MSFLIVSGQRTGSNLLLSVLNSHPNILCDNEIFLKKYWRNPDDKPNDLCDVFLNGSINEKNGCIVPFSNILHDSKDMKKNIIIWGMLCKYNQISIEILDFLYSTLVDFKVIHLIRDNFINQCLSHFIIDLKKRTAKSSNIQLNPDYFYYKTEKKETPVVFNEHDLNLLKKRFLKEKKRRNKFLEYFKNKNHLEITYEELTKNKNIKYVNSNVKNKICNYLSASSEYEMFGTIIKNKYAQPNKLIINYDEVISFLNSLEN